MNLFKYLMTFAAILFATAAFAQTGNGHTSAEQYGPARPIDTSGGTSTGTDSSYFYHEPFKINKKLDDKLKTMLPQNLTPKAAARGFLDLQDFVATVRAANNLSVPFSDLKHKMADGSSGELEKAIHKLKPDVAAKEEVKKAKDQAKEDIKESKRS